MHVLTITNITIIRHLIVLLFSCSRAKRKISIPKKNISFTTGKKFEQHFLQKRIFLTKSPIIYNTTHKQKRITDNIFFSTENLYNLREKYLQFALAVHHSSYKNIFVYISCNFFCFCPRVEKVFWYSIHLLYLMSYS